MEFQCRDRGESADRIGVGASRSPDTARAPVESSMPEILRKKTRFCPESSKEVIDETG